MDEKIYQEQNLETEERRRTKMTRYAPTPSPLEMEGNMRENINFFTRMWKNYVLASGLTVEDEKTKVAQMMTIIGDGACKIIYKIMDNPESNSVDEILTTLKKKLAPELNVRYERYIFNNLEQSNDESFQQYLMKLKTQIKLCAYKDMEDELLVDKIISSVKDIKLREKLWLEKDLKLEKAIEICKSSEETKKQLEIIESQKENEIRKVEFKNSKNQSKESRLCSYCGQKWHQKLNKCPARLATCHNCKIKGHFASVCRRKKMKEIQDNDNSITDENSIDVIKHNQFKINNKVMSEKGVFVTLKVILKDDSEKNVCFQLDTGACCNVIGEKALNKIFNRKNIELSPCTSILTAINGTRLGVKGKCYIKVRKDEKIHDICFIIVDYDHMPILSYKECANLKLITYSKDVTTIKKVDALNENKSLEKLRNVPNSTKQIIEKYNDVFQGLGRMKGLAEIEIINDRPPVKQSPRRIPIALKEDLKKEIEDMIQQNIITEEPGYTDWISNVTIVKKNNKLRVCLDPTFLNQAIKDTKQQLPTLDEIIPELNKAKIFSTIDAKKGFWQVELTERSSKLTAFWTPFGKFRYLRLPFGLSTAMEIFQKKMLEITNGLKGVHVLADDILVVGYGDNEDDAQKNHDENLEKLLDRLRKENVKLNEEKTNLCKKEIKFYGHVLTSEGVKPDKSKITAIINMPVPCDKEAVQRFLGMVTYLSRYIPNLSNVTEPLRKLVRKEESFIWTKTQEDAYNEIKKIVSEATLLRFFDTKKPVVIQTDSSSFAVGCALMQEGFPVAYASKTLTTTQRNYAQIEKEMLAILFACQRFDQYICGKSDVIIETDHSPLVSIFKKPLLKTPKRLQNMILSLQRYNIMIKYRQGKSMYLADTLSRAPESIQNNEKQMDIYKVTSENIEEYDEISTIEQLKTGIEYDCIYTVDFADKSIQKIAEETRNDDQLQLLKKQIRDGWPQTRKEVPDDIKCYWNYRCELTMEEDIILKQNQILIPRSLRKEYLKKLHMGHMGTELTQRLARQSVFWPNITTEIRELIGSCETCAKFSSKQKKLEMKSHETPNAPFETISMDVFEINMHGQKRKFLITVDHFSDFIEIDELKDMTSRNLILICKRHFSRYGIPKTVISDNGSNFASKEFKEFSKNWCFNHITSSPHYPQSNGKAEASVKIMKKMIKKCMEEGEDFYKMLLVYRNTPNKIGFSPSKRMMGRWLRCDLPNTDKYKILEPEEIKKRIDDNKNRSKIYYDKGAVKRNELQVGQEIWYRKLPQSDEWSKGKIIEDTGNRSFNIETEEGAVLRRNEVFLRPQRTRKIPTRLNDYHLY